MELSKSENRIARQIFEISLQRELKQQMEIFAEILKKWKGEMPDDNRENYYELFTAVKDFDKHIARRYDDLRNSWFYNTLIELLATNVIDEADLNGFSPERKTELINRSKSWANQ